MTDIWPGRPRAPVDQIARDKSWTQCLPQGSSVISAIGFGSSYWSESGKVDVSLADGDRATYFIKLSRDDHDGRIPGQQMVQGEYESLKAMYKFIPDMIPEPVHFGTYSSDRTVHFLLCKFVELEDGESPDPVDFCSGLAELHKKSMEDPPGSNFGFEVTTCDEIVPQYNQWSCSWEAFFIEHLKKAVYHEEIVHGPSPELEEMLPKIYEKVCPRLLRPLETEGNTIKPCLVHGDLWDGNVATHSVTGKPYVKAMGRRIVFIRDPMWQLLQIYANPFTYTFRYMFDPSSLWAHNEYDLHKFRPQRYKFGMGHVREYFRHVTISAPRDEWQDRLHLYSLIADLHSSTLFPQSKKIRQVLIDSMRELVDKYPNGYEGSAKQKGTR